jgi:diguanylate cyclase
MALALAAVVAEQKRSEERLRRLSVTDPLTGVANYRHLVNVLESEIRRSQRTLRPFAMLFLDVDRLKKINDRHGHLVGSRVLCRVAEVLRRSCRTTDTVARYGGDEFALVLPETDEAAARQVADRIPERLAADGGNPPVSVSVGVSAYPRDGTTAEMLLGRADHLLYASKARIDAPDDTA